MPSPSKIAKDKKNAMSNAMAKALSVPSVSVPSVASNNVKIDKALESLSGKNNWMTISDEIVENLDNGQLVQLLKRLVCVNGQSEHEDFYNALARVNGGAGVVEKVCAEKNAETASVVKQAPAKPLPYSTAKIGGKRR